MPSVEYLGDYKPINYTLPLVSVCTVTYQHAAYISECLDGILSQETKFRIEILVGEDESSDGTREICIAYADKFPDRIRLFLNKREDVIFINGRPTGRSNFLNLLTQARGKYIAICPGDDYWIDPDKLQKQVDFLEQHEEYSFIFHNVFLEAFNKDDSSEQRQTFHPANFDESEDLAKTFMVRNIVPTASVVMRNNIPRSFPDIFYKVAFGDWPLHIYNLNFGKAKYIKDVMAVYRIGSGNWSKRTTLDQHLAVLQAYRYLPDVAPQELIDGLKSACEAYYRGLIYLYVRERKLYQALKTGIRLWWYRRTGKTI